MGKAVAVMAGWCGLVCFMSPAPADDIYLKNGRIVQAEVMEQTDTYLEVRTKVGKIKFSLNDVQRVEKKELPGNFFEEKKKPASQAKPAVTEKPVPTGGAAAKPAEETASAAEEEAADIAEELAEDRAEKLAASQPAPVAAANTMSVTAKFEEVNKKAVIRANGTTTIPDGALICVFFKRLNEYIVAGECIAQNKTFDITFGPFDKPLIPGEYNVQAVFMPEKQSEEFKKALKGKGANKLEASCTLYVGNIEKARENEASAKKEILSIISDLEGLRAELEEAYRSNRNNFNGQAWQEWSDKWFEKFKKVRIRAQKSDPLVSLYPETRKSMPMSITYLSDIYLAVTKDLKDPKKAGNLPETFQGDIGRVNEFRNAATRMKEEVAAPPAPAVPPSGPARDKKDETTNSI